MSFSTLLAMFVIAKISLINFPTQLPVSLYHREVIPTLRVQRSKAVEEKRRIAIAAPLPINKLIEFRIARRKRYYTRLLSDSEKSAIVDIS